MQYRKVTQVLIKGGHPNVDLAIFPRSVHTAIPELYFREGLLSDSSNWTSVDLSVTTPGGPAAQLLLCFWYNSEMP